MKKGVARRGDLIKAMMLENPITEEDQLEVNAKVYDQIVSFGIWLLQTIKALSS